MSNCSLSLKTSYLHSLNVTRCSNCVSLPGSLAMLEGMTGETAPCVIKMNCVNHHFFTAITY